MSDTVTVSPTLTPASGMIAGPMDSGRVASIDVFRGITMMFMIFVNELAGVRGLPWWTYHAKTQQDVMTYVDMVYPFFLFILGVSMPLAIERRLVRNPSQTALWRHIAMRSAGLIVLGLILANAEFADAARMGVSPDNWMLLGLAGGILFWLAPSRNPRLRNLYRGLRILGLMMLIAVFAIFRHTTGAGDNVAGGTVAGTVAWIDGSYPEILGLIGYTYFAVALLYVPTRRWRWMPLAWFATLVVFCAFETAHVLRLQTLPLYFWPFNSGAWASMVMAGVATSGILLGKDGGRPLRARMWLAFAFAMATLAAAWFLAPLGISKNRGTPTWCLASIGASVLVLMLLYWVCDVQGKTRWARPVEPAGENTLLTYLLPDMFYPLAALFGFRYLDDHFNVGSSGVIRSMVFTCLILLISAGLTRARIRLQL